MKKGKIFYGWWIVAVITIMTFFMGAAPFAIVLKQIMEQFNTGRGLVSLSISIASIVGGVTGIFVGRLVQHHRVKPLVIYGSIGSGVSSILLGLANNLAAFYAFSFLAGLAMGFAGAITMFTVLSKWFNRHWGAAVGITQAGGAVGSLLIRPLVGLIAENIGWRPTYFFAGALTLLVTVPLIIFVLKESPQSMGLLPDGDKPGDAKRPAEARPAAPTSPARTAGGAGLGTYLKKPALWLMGLSFAVLAVGDAGVTQHEVSFITDMQISATIAASALGFTMGISGISRIASGWLSDRISSRYVSIFFLIIEIIGMFILMHANNMSRVWLFVIVYGLGTGAAGTLLPIMIRDIFGSADFSVIFGFINALFTGGGAIGVPMAGFIFDATGSYARVFVIVAIIYGAAILGIYAAFGARPRPFARLLRD